MPFRQVARVHPHAAVETAPTLSVVVPLAASGFDLKTALDEFRREADTFGIPYELIVASFGAGADLVKTIEDAGARFVTADGDRFGCVLRAGVDAARGEYVLTVDAACGGAAAAAGALWRSRAQADIIIGSRYVGGANSQMFFPRRLASRLLNGAFGRGLSLPSSDLSSVFRLCRREIWRQLPLVADDYDVLPESLVRVMTGGWRAQDIPLSIDLPRRRRALRPLFNLALAYARTFGRLWLMRNSIEAADYDARAYDSRIPLQRYWQRQRYRHVLALIRGQGPVLDVGCGSSRIMTALPAGSVALDILPNKLRYARRLTRRLVRASGFHLPFADASFPCVLCSQVIEHVPIESPMLAELCRVLAPAGRLVLGTPDYSRWEWVWMEKAYGFFKPHGYADEHIAHYTRDGLLRYFQALGWRHEHTRYILHGELILAFRKP